MSEVKEIEIARASIQYPLVFMAVPSEEVIDLFIKVKKGQVKAIQQAKNELLSSWRKMTEERPETSCDNSKNRNRPS